MRVIPTTAYGIVNYIFASHEVLSVFEVHLSDGVIVRDSHHLVVRNPLGYPVASLDHGNNPPFLRVGDRISSSASLVSELLYCFADDFYGFPCGAGVLGNIDSYIVENAAVCKVISVFP